MVGFMISQGFLVAQVWIPPAAQMYQPSLNVPPGQWGQPSGVERQRPEYREEPSVGQPTRAWESDPDLAAKCALAKEQMSVFTPSAEFQRRYRERCKGITF